MYRINSNILKVLVVVAALAVIQSAPAAAQTSIDELLLNLESHSPDDSVEFRNHLLMERQTLVAGLIGFLEAKEAKDVNPQSDDYSAVITAIQILGDIRAVESAAVLLNYIDLPLVGEELSRRLKPASELYPAVNSLIQIGIPAIQAILERLASEEALPKVSLNLAVGISMAVFRDTADYHNHEMAISVFRNQRKYDKSERYGRRIDAAISILQGQRIEDGIY